MDPKKEKRKVQPNGPQKRKVQPKAPQKRKVLPPGPKKERSLGFPEVPSVPSPKLQAQGSQTPGTPGPGTLGTLGTFLFWGPSGWTFLFWGALGWTFLFWGPLEAFRARIQGNNNRKNNGFTLISQNPSLEPQEKAPPPWTPKKKKELAI